MTPTKGYSIMKKCQKEKEDVTPVRGSMVRRSRRVLNQPAFRECTKEVSVNGVVGKVLQHPPKLTKPTSTISKIRVLKLVSTKPASTLVVKQRNRRKSKGLLCGINMETDSPMKSPAVISPLRRSPRIQAQPQKTRPQEFKPAYLTDYVRDPRLKWKYSPSDFPEIPDAYASFKLPKLERSTTSTTSSSSMMDAVLSTLDRKNRKCKPGCLLNIDIGENEEEGNEGDASEGERNDEEQMPTETKQDTQQCVNIKHAKSMPDIRSSSKLKVVVVKSPLKRIVSSYSIPQQMVAIVPRVKVAVASSNLTLFGNQDIKKDDSRKIPQNIEVRTAKKDAIKKTPQRNETKGEEKDEMVESEWKNTRSQKRLSRKVSFRNAVGSPLDDVKLNIRFDKDKPSIESSEESESEQEGSKNKGDVPWAFDLSAIPMIDETILDSPSSQREEVGVEEGSQQQIKDRDQMARDAWEWRSARSRRTPRKASFRLAVRSPQDGKQKSSDEEAKPLAMDIDGSTEATAQNDKENAESLKRKRDISKPRTLSKNDTTRSDGALPEKTTLTPRARASASRLQDREKDATGPLSAKRTRSVTFITQPVEIQVRKEKSKGLIRRVSFSMSKMRRNKSTEKLNKASGGDMDESLVMNAGNTPKPQRQPKGKFEERLIM